jgi:hypothetical protein
MREYINGRKDKMDQVSKLEALVLFYIYARLNFDCLNTSSSFRLSPVSRV